MSIVSYFRGAAAGVSCETRPAANAREVAAEAAEADGRARTDSGSAVLAGQGQSQGQGQGLDQGQGQGLDQERALRARVHLEAKVVHLLARTVAPQVWCPRAAKVEAAGMAPLQFLVLTAGMVPLQFLAAPHPHPPPARVPRADGEGPAASAAEAAKGVAAGPCPPAWLLPGPVWLLPDPTLATTRTPTCTGERTRTAR